MRVDGRVHGAGELVGADRRRCRTVLLVVMAAASFVGAVASLSSVASATFPGRDGRLLLALNPSSEPEQLWAADPRGGRALRLLTGPYCNADFFGAAVAPGGRLVAFSSITACGGTVGDPQALMLADGDGRRLRELAQLPSTPAFSTPDETFYEQPGTLSFSPDGRTVAYGINESRGRASLGHLVDFFSIATGHLARTLVLPGALTGPDWGPTGQLAFVTPTGQVQTMTAIGRNRHVLSIGFPADGPWSVSGVDWSPDGRRLVLDAIKDRADCGYGDLPNCTTDLFVAPATGGRAHRLTHTGDAAGALWSPEGDQIAFTSNVRNMVLSLRSGHLAEIARTAPHGSAVVGWEASTGSAPAVPLHRRPSR